MPELHPENNAPLNQAAKQLLKQAGQVPRQNALYVVQLMQWSLENDLDDLKPVLRDRISDSVESLLGAPPKEAMFYLVQAPSGDQGEVSLSERSLEGLNPDEAATALLQHLHEKMSETVPGYPIAAPLP